MRFVMRSNKKKKGRPAHTPATFHTHIPTHPSGICYEANFHICEKKKRTEVRAGSLKTKQQQQPDTMIHCRVRGQILERHMGSAAVPFLSHMLHFSFEVGKLRFRECARCETGCVTFFFFFHFGGRNETLHPASCCDSQQDIVKCAQFFCPDLCTT